MFNVQCFFYAYFKITISRINHFKTITRVVVFTGCAWWQMFFDRRRWSSMFLYSGGQMSDSFAKDYYCIDVKVVFSSFKVKNYFSLKCHTPMPLMANVVYQFTCLRDANSTYISKTIRLCRRDRLERGVCGCWPWGAAYISTVFSVCLTPWFF